MAAPRRRRSFDDDVAGGAPPPPVDAPAGALPSEEVFSDPYEDTPAAPAATPAAQTAGRPSLSRPSLSRPSVSRPSVSGGPAPARPAPARPAAVPSRPRRSRAFDEGSDGGAPPAAGPSADRKPARKPDDADAGDVRLSGYVTRIIFKNEDRGFHVLGISPRQNTSPRDTVAITMQGFAPQNGDHVEFIGRWTERQGRRQLSAQVGHVKVARTNAGIRRWMKKDVAGVGEAAIERLERHFGVSLAQCIDDPEKLQESGISQAQAEAISTAWTANEYHTELMTEVMGHGLPSRVASRIVDTYGGGIRNILKTNPWQLAEIKGVGFPTADAIAVTNGCPPDSPNRIFAGLVWTMKNETDGQGHTGLPEAMLVERASKLLKLRASTVSPHLEELVTSASAIHDREAGLYYPPDLHRAETYVAERLGNMAALPDIMTQERAIELATHAAKINGMRLHPHQMDAVVMALVKPVCVITGGPGTGKSTVQKIVVDSLRLAEYELSLACPTGKAAKRLSSTSGMDASTIHRQLVYFTNDEGESGFYHNEANPLDAGRYINDEQSMVTLKLACSQLEAIPEGAGLIMVGDVKQLPSVGAGQVLKDCIDSGVIPVTRLTQTFRTANNSGVAVAAQRIDAGEYPVHHDERLRGFRMIEAEDGNVTYEVQRLLTEVLPEKGYSIRDDVAVLGAVKDGDLGIRRLNRVVKHSVNPAWKDDKTRTIGDMPITVGDPMMQNTNCYTKNITNGELGIVTGFPVKQTGSKEEYGVDVSYEDGTFSYYGQEQDQIELSWANTTHKYQGSERSVVIVVIPQAHNFSLTRAGIYTALTRAKVEAYFVGSPDALRSALRRTETDIRHTGLASRLRTVYSQAMNISLADIPRPQEPVQKAQTRPTPARPAGGRLSLTPR